ncbi:MAG: efflux RND transporter permease subunit [Gammaproteobacteria bacterium]|nr:efflux RND transporter permease subunit [Gammaproteobacteria bacterium]
MQKFKNKFDKLLAHLAYYIYDNAKRSLAVIVLLTLVFSFGISKLQVETSIEGMFHPDDQTFINYEAFKQQFGQDSIAIAALQSDELFTLPVLQRLKAFHIELEETVPYVDKVTSLFNVTSIRGQGGELLVNELLDKFPESKQEMAALKAYVLNNAIYQKRLISDEGNFTIITIRPGTGLQSTVADNDFIQFDEFNQASPKTTQIKAIPSSLNNIQKNEFSQAIKKLVEKYNNDANFKIYLSGGPIVDVEHDSSIHKDVGAMIMAAGVLIFFLLALIFRRVSGVVLPLCVVMLTLISIFGVIGFLGIPISPVSQMLPSLLIAICVADTVHFLSLFYPAYGDMSKRDAVAHALKKSGLPMIFTSLTTAAGFIAFSQADLLPIAHLGIATPIGVMFALLFTFMLLPALISLFDIKVKKPVNNAYTATQVMVNLGRIGYQRPAYTIISFSLITILVMSAGLSNLRFSHDVVSWLPEDNWVRMNTEAIDKELGTTLSLEVIVDTGKENGLYDSRLMQDLADIQSAVEALEVNGMSVSKTYSVVDILKQINMALNEGQPAFHVVPESKALIAQALLLFENSNTDDLENIIDNQFSMLRITLRLPQGDAFLYLPLRNELEMMFRAKFEDYATVTVTGYLDLLSQSFVNVIDTMTESYLIAFLIIALLMLLIFGDLRFGLISLAPNFFPIIMALSFMGIAGIPIDMFTVLMGCIAFGLAVDDSVHFIHHVQRNYQRSNDMWHAIETAISSVGRAILITSCTLVGAFSLYLFASVGTLASLGMVLSVAIISALIADIILVPALLSLAYRKKSKEA